MEYTLEDTYEDLKEIQEQLRKEEQDITTKILNNRVSALNQSCTPQEVREKQHKLAYQLLKYIPQAAPIDHPIPKTKHICVEALKELEEEIHNAQQLLDKMQNQLHDIEDDTSYLENKKNGFNKMREMYMASTEIMGNKTYKNELSMIKRLFQEARNDLQKVVDIIFPDNESFGELLRELTTAYMRGGDDIYVNVTMENFNYVKYLIETAVVTYHPHDTKRIRMADLL